MKKWAFWPPAVPLGQDKPRRDRHLERGGATTLASLKQAVKKLQDKQKLGLRDPGSRLRVSTFPLKMPRLGAGGVGTWKLSRSSDFLEHGPQADPQL